jgi:amidohydrolase
LISYGTLLALTGPLEMPMKQLTTFALLTAISASVCGSELDLRQSIETDYQKSLGALWQHFHQNPELSGQETQTAARMAKELRAIKGVQVTEKVGGTGIVAILKNGLGKTVMLRADMDGLPVEEKSGLAHASKARQKNASGEVQPVMHACGHDVHITALIATARQLAANKDRWQGTVMMIVQPAEETLVGAQNMLKDGLYTRFGKPDYALAFHVAADLPTGKISAGEGIQYSSVDTVNITVQGIGTHGAAPHLGKDPIYIASQIVIGLQGIISREKPPLEPAVITVGSFHSGNRPNIISERAELELTVRTNSQNTRAQILDAIQRLTRGVGIANGLPEDKLPVVKVGDGTAATVNDAGLAKRLNNALAKSLGPNVVAPYTQKNMGGEDFAYFVEATLGVPGYYFNVGGTKLADLEAAENGGPIVAGHHSPFFKIEPFESVVLGSQAMTEAVFELLGSE